VSFREHPSILVTGILVIVKAIRSCACPHGFPLCACFEGLTGPALVDRSRWLSSLAGWPARVDPSEAARVIAEHGRPAPQLQARTLTQTPWPVWLALPRVDPAVGPPGGCGCGRA
jgi:hypothetical protein